MSAFPVTVALCGYLSIILAIQQILRVGQDAQSSKLDIKDAYRIVPVHPGNWPLLGMQL